jgi:hypothetical protein
MKKFYFLLVMALGFNMAINAQIVDDDFEDYPLGPYFGGHWSNWDMTSGAANLIITDSQAFSGEKSGTISADGQDVLWVIDPVFFGVYTLQWKMLVPQDRSAWIGFMEDATALGDDSMPLKLYFNTNADINGTDYDNKMYLGLYAGEGTVSLSEPIDYPIGEWATYKITLDLDTSIMTFSINGTEVIATEYTAPNFQFGGADLWKFDTGNIFITGATPTNDPCEWYIDDLTFVEGELGVSEVNTNSSISVYPTVATETFNVTSKNIITEVSIFNTAGQQVMRVSPNSSTANISVNALQSGVYIVKVAAGKEVKTSKIIVK